jgi:zinc protease
MRLLRRNTITVALASAVLWAQAVALLAGESLRDENRTPVVPVLKVEQYNLPNGLTVILHEDHKTPLVAVNIIYRVGSKDDPPGRTGLAHLIEHLMFEGSQHCKESYYLPIYRCYTEAQGATSKDQTVYHVTVTANALELALWLEADRMGFLLPSVTQAKLDGVRGVIKNERRQRFDDAPFGEVEEVMARLRYPPGHPYRHVGIGSMADLAGIRLADVSEFVKKHYVPNNAFLCVAGDFRPAEAKRWIADYFGPLHRGSLASAPETKPKAPWESRRVTLTDQVSHALARLDWATVPANHPDEAALDVLAAVLGGGAWENRLYRALLHDRQIAGQVDASHPTNLLAGNFVVDLYARPGQKLSELVRLADLEIERLRREGPTAVEIRNVQIERERSQIMELESVTSQAALLNFDAATQGDPLAYQAVLARIFAVTADDVKRVAREYIGTRRIELDVLHGARAARASEVEPDHGQRARQVELPEKPIDKDFTFSIMPEIGPAPQFSPPSFDRRILSNGLKLLLAARHGLPVVSLKLVVKSGETAVPRGKEGLCSIVVSLLEAGTKSRSAFQLEGELREIGASLSTDGRLESSMIGLTTLTHRLDRALELYADFITNSSFPDEELYRLKIDRLGLLQARADHPDQIAEDVFPRLLYPPDHPYARAVRGTPESVQSITREDVVAFYRRHFVPGNAELVVVGDVRPDAIAAALEARFANWAPGPIPRAPGLPPIPPPAVNDTLYLIDKPGAAQSVLAIGRTGTTVHAPDRYALEILKETLGGRINSKVRDAKANSYGFFARLETHKAAGPLIVIGSVATTATKETLVDVLEEMTRLSEHTAIAAEEFIEIRDGMLPPWFDRFETVGGVASQVAYLVSHELPYRQFATDQSALEAVKKADVERVAKQYLTPRRMTILIVGDRSRIEAPLRTLPFVKSVRLLDTNGRPVSAPPASKPRAANTTVRE